MSQSSPLFSIAASAATAFTIVSAIFISPDFATAAEVDKPGATCNCPSNGAAPANRPRIAALTKPLDETDEIAALESVQFALTQVADGSSYVWHRTHGRLSGIVKPLLSYKSSDGSVCRKLTVILSSGDNSKRTTTSACRMADGIWKLEG